MKKELIAELTEKYKLGSSLSELHMEYLLSQESIRTHIKKELGNSYDNYHKDASCKRKDSYQNKVISKSENYRLNPKICTECNKTISFEKRSNKFCSRVCGIKSSNKRRDPQSEITKEKKSKSLLKFYNEKDPSVSSRRRPKKRIDSVPRVKLTLEQLKLKQIERDRSRSKYPTGTKKCFTCDNIISVRPKYCSSCHPNLPHYRTLCEFKFNVYEYPNEFDLELLNSLGWYSPNGYKSRNKNINIDGVSRDHLYSVSDGFVNNKDPNILAHPANCRLIKHNGPEGNSSKNKNSFLTWEELLDKIAKWNEKYKIYVRVEK